MLRTPTEKLKLINKTEDLDKIIHTVKPQQMNKYNRIER